jgi:TolB protein
VIGVGGEPPSQITGTGAAEVHPSWSPDGTQLVYCSLPVEGGQWELWLVDAVAGGRQRFIGYGLFPEWSPVGDTIVYQRARERGSRWFSVWTLTLVDGEPRYPTEVAAGASRAMILPSWSPDGRQIAYASVSATFPEPGGTFLPNPSEVSDIWVVNADGSGRMRLTDGYTANHAPVFSPDGRVYFASNRSGHENTWSAAPLSGSARTWTADGPELPAGQEPATWPTARTASHNDDL